MKIKLKPADEQIKTCFGIHHSGFFKFFVFINMMQNIVCIGLVTYEVAITVKALQILTVDPLDERIKLYLRAIAWAWFIVQCITSFGMDIRLFQTAEMPKIHFLRFYALLHSISLPLFFALYYTLLLLGGSILPYPPVLANVLLPCHVIYRLYTSYIVYRYSKDIDFHLQMTSAFRNLTESEVSQFELGLAELEDNMDTLRIKAKVYETCYEMATFEKYKRKEFEIPLANLDLTNSSTLGFGEYGCVYKAELIRQKERIEVAVKTVNPDMSDVNHFKALLSEAKVMTFMGHHENVVELIGICTEEIRLRKLYVVCELCQYGSLLSYLRSERNTFINLMSPNIEADLEINTALNTNDLLKWAYEIATGMEFLSSKRIIHGDLAARNVLLNVDKTAKITDFGLSRRLYNYSVYRKKQSVPLPWKWLALESLVDMDFSSMSDVWMFGVCLWEIFELGGRPWPDVNIFCSGFIEKLKEGRRMEMPKYCNKEIYEIMLSCWNADANCRPTFSKLSMYFSDIKCQQ